LPYLDHLAAGFGALLERYLPERHAKTPTMNSMSSLLLEEQTA
jgi:hypothetical protein